MGRRESRTAGIWRPLLLVACVLLTAAAVWLVGGEPEPAPAGITVRVTEAEESPRQQDDAPAGPSNSNPAPPPADAPAPTEEPHETIDLHGRVIEEATGAPITIFEVALLPCYDDPSKLGAMPMFPMMPRKTMEETTPPPEQEGRETTDTSTRLNVGGIEVEVTRPSVEMQQAMRQAIAEMVGPGMAPSPERRHYWPALHSGADWMPVQDRDGRFTISAPAAEARAVAARAPGFEQSHVVVEMDDSATSTTLQLKLRRMGKIIGTVVTEQGRPIAGADVTPYDMMGLTHDARPMKTDIQGRFEFQAARELGPSGPLPARPSFRVDHPGFARGNGRAELAPGRVTQTTVILPDCGVLRGRVTRGGVPVPDVRLSAGYARGRSDAQGCYTLARVEAGERQIRLANDGLAYQRAVCIEPGRRNVLDIDLPPVGASLSGQVLVGGEPAQEDGKAELTVYHASERIQLKGGVTLDSEGRFLIEGLPEGIGVVSVALRESNTECVKQVPLSTRRRQHLEFELSDTGVVSGEVFPPEGTVETGVRLLAGIVATDLLREDAKLANGLNVDSFYGSPLHRNFDGRFTFERVPPGTYTLIAWSTDLVSNGDTTREERLDATRFTTQTIEVRPNEEIWVELAF